MTLFIGVYALQPRKNSTQELMQSSKVEMPNKYYFGIRSWHPQWLQFLASAKFYTFCLCAASLIEGALVSGMF